MHCSPEYAEQQRKLHATGEYGVTGQQYGPLVSKIIDQMEIETLLDYGCGSNLSLTKTLKPERKFNYQGYDIGVPKYSDDPVPSQMVACIDVIEHIEPAFLEDVLDHLQELTEQVLLISVHTGPAKKVLDDGRNAHLIQQPLGWWFPKIDERFCIQSLQVMNRNHFHIIAYADD